MFLGGGLASAQTALGKPVATPSVLPAIHTATEGEPQPILRVGGTADTGNVQKTAYQGRIQPLPSPEDGADFDFELELPPPERVFRLESEAGWQQRLKQRELDKGKPPPIFPEYAVLSKDKYYGRQWEQRGIHPEPNYVVYGRLYFEQKNFERYGWDLGILSPIVESLVFGADVALLPYHMGTDPLRCYDSNAGYCLPGDPTPLLLYPPQLSATGAIAEAGTIAGLIAAFP